MSSLSFEDFRYDVKGFIKQVKDDIGITAKVRIFPIRNRPLALSRMRDVPEIELPTTPTIVQQLGISESEAIARSKVAIVEEFCHVHHTEDHTPRVYECVRTRVEKFMSPEEKRLVEGKMERFRNEAVKFKELEEADRLKIERKKETDKKPKLLEGTTLNGSIEAGKVKTLEQFQELQAQPNSVPL